MLYLLELLFFLVITLHLNWLFFQELLKLSEHMGIVGTGMLQVEPTLLVKVFNENF